MPDLMQMLTYCRPEGSRHQLKFNRRFIEPVFGKPDLFGNYFYEVSGAPELAFMAHHDTVHVQSGRQQIRLENDMIRLEDGSHSNCLGADCTTGVWLILEMIEARVPGRYIIHAGEEKGCLGSKALVKSSPDWLHEVKAAIAFDRYGTQSIITHQMSMRTASDTFGNSLADALGVSSLKLDDGGSYTDSNSYADIVSECTNISVGYYGQHGKKEEQDVLFAYEIRDALICADFTNLVFERDPSVPEYLDWYSNYRRPSALSLVQEDFLELVTKYPEDVARLLAENYHYEDICEELGIFPSAYVFGRFQ